MSTSNVSPANLSPRRALAQMLVGNQIQQAIYVAAKLGIADQLADGPKSSKALAQTCGADARALYRLLRTLASFGVFREVEDDCFELTPIAALLQKGIVGSARDVALWSGGVSYQSFGALEYSVMSGKPAFEKLFACEFFDYLDRNPEIGSLFDNLMSWHTAPLAPLIAAYDFADANVVVDIAGGRGELLAAILSTHPQMRGVLVDHARVIQNAKGVLEEADVAERCTLVCGDIMESIPSGGDVYILKSVLHGFDDDTATRLLKNCAQVMDRGARLLVIEFVMPPGNEPFPAKLMDLLMLVGCYGYERTIEEFSSLFAAAGFRLSNIMATKFGYSVLQASISVTNRTTA